ncbi:MAG: PCRF domain-containing protein, partial [Bacillota bacterium]|nr:PCRF domain-containing protein [Bacillota bacterium]
MLEKLRVIKNRYELLTDLVSDPNVIARQNEWRAYIKEQASLTTLVNAFNRYEKTLQERDQSQQALA